jgi:CCR4-NOT transcription complex subunit 3
MSSKSLLFCIANELRWCAAEALKKEAWRFHKQYLTWFQRAASPTAVTDDYEQGPYTYFDWENVWCTRRKSDFRFEVSLEVKCEISEC